MSPRKANKVAKGNQKPKPFNIYTIDTEEVAGNTPLCDISVGTPNNLQKLPGYGSYDMLRVSSNEKPKLSGKKDDFSFWKIRAEAHFTKIGLEDVIDNPTPDPTKNKLLYIELVSLVDNECLQLIASTTKYNGKAAFDKLSEYYLGNVNARTVNALQELNNLKMKPQESVKAFLARCDLLKDNLIALNLSDGHEMTLVLNANKALPARFDYFKLMTTTSNPLPNWEAFKLKCMNFDSIEYNNPSVNPIMNVQNYNHRPQIVHRKPYKHFKKFINKPKTVACHICQTFGSHNTKDCWKNISNNSKPQQFSNKHKNKWSKNKQHWHSNPKKGQNNSFHKQKHHQQNPGSQPSQRT